MSVKAIPNRDNAAPDFDSLAGVYRWMEWLSFGPFLHRARRAFLLQLSSSRNAVIFGDGDGRFTADLLNTNPRIQIDAVDASPAMLGSLMRRAGTNAHRITAHIADAREWKPDPTACYDLVVTHFFLDCLTTEEVRTLARCVRPHLKPGALWLLSDFAQPPGLYGRLIAAPIISFLYQAFGVLTGLRVRHLPNHAAALSEAGLTQVKRQSYLGGLLTAELWQA